VETYVSSATNAFVSFVADLAAAGTCGGWVGW
jgi:hypothetical protein